MKEIWKDIEGTSGKYMISNLGNAIGVSGRQLKLTKMQIGYLSIAISLNGKPRRHYIHILVASHFLRKTKLDGFVVNHKDGNKHNNVVSNLEYISRKENAKHWARKNRSNEAGRKRTGYCHRGHKLDGKKTYCLQCRRNKKAGMEFKPPTDCNWKKIPNIDYLVSDTGLIWSNKTKRIMRSGIDTPGYKYVVLRVDGRNKRFSINRQVAQSFISPIDEGMIVDHINSDKLDNRVVNLRIISSRDNSLYSRKKLRNDNRHGFKFSPEEAAEIKWLALNSNLSHREIGNYYGMSQSYVSSIKLGKQWRHIQPKEPDIKK